MIWADIDRLRCQQAQEPLAVMKACRAIIHGGVSVEEAVETSGFTPKSIAA